jgi:hypothetical protein
MIGASFLFVLAGALGTPILEMTPERIREAIDYGRSNGEANLAQYPLHSEESWHANFDTPFLRIAQLSAALRRADKPMGESDVPSGFATGQVHVYVHAKDTGTRSPRSVGRVSLVEPGREGHVENVMPPVYSSTYVRRVPLPEASASPARIARSVKAVFPIRLFLPGNKLRVTFDDGTSETVALEAKLFASVR